MNQNTFTITHPLTGKPLEKTPDDISLMGVTFASKEKAEEFINKHWPKAVLMTDVNNKIG